MKSRSLAILAFAVAGTGAAVAQFNQLIVQPRVWNDIPGSNLTITNDYPWSVSLTETGLQAASGFANRHLFVFSADGANPGVINNNTHFEASVDVNLNSSNPARRKESGFQIVQPWGGDGPFMVASDGEIAVFGEWLPFKGWGNTAYTAGTTKTITFRYLFDPSDAFNKVEYIQGGNSSGLLIPGNLEQGFIDNSGFRLYSQNRRSEAGEDVTLTYSNFRVFRISNGKISGRVSLRGRSDLAGLAATVEVRTPGTTLAVATQDVTLAADGSWSFDSTLTGTYDIAVKPVNGLREVVENVSSKVGGWGAATLHLTGDIDGDNSVTVFDYDALSTAFDTAAGDAGFNPLADLDGDGSITVFDYDLLSTYFDATGDN